MKTINTYTRGAAVFGMILILTLTLGAQQGRGRGRIRGSVVGQDGNPLQGAKITAVFKQSGMKFDTTTDKKGNWAIGGLGSGQFLIVAEREGYETAQQDITVSQFSANNPAINLTLKKIAVQEDLTPDSEDSAALALFEEGNVLFAEDKFEEAASKYKEFLALSPESFLANINLGNCYRGLEQYDSAIAAFTTVLDRVRQEQGSYSDSEAASRALIAIGETYILKGDIDKASENLQEAAALFPEDEALAFNIGEIYFTKGDAANAVVYFNKAIALKPDWPPAYRARGYALLNLTDYKGALESFQKFLELAPDDPRAAPIRSLIPELEKMIKK
jgi:tetratricopeptide (TPR) repeat protein